MKILLSLDFGPVFKYINTFLNGVLGTLGFSVATIVIGSILGFLLCLVRISKFKPISLLAQGYIGIIRGTPMLIQLFIFAYGIPMFFGIDIDLTIAGIIALGLNSTAYVAEIFRAGIQAVDPGQMEGCRAMGYSYNFAMWKIVFPQAVKNILPSLGNEFVTIVKESSIISVIGLTDITRASDLAKAGTARVLESLLFAAVLYLIITTVLSYLIKLLERKLNAYAKK